MVAIKCGHTYHRECIIQWLLNPNRQRCPQCQAPSNVMEISRPLRFDPGLDDSLMEDEPPATPRHVYHQMAVAKRKIDEQLAIEHARAAELKQIEDAQNVEIQLLKQQLADMEAKKSKKIQIKCLQNQSANLSAERNALIVDNQRRQLHLDQLKDMWVCLPEEDRQAADHLETLEQEKIALQDEHGQLQQAVVAVNLEAHRIRSFRLGNLCASTAASRMRANLAANRGGASSTANNRGGRGGRGGGRGGGDGAGPSNRGGASGNSTTPSRNRGAGNGGGAAKK